MIKVKTFTQKLEIMKAVTELKALDLELNLFIENEKVKRVISVSDTATTNDKGMTMGIVRVLTYEV